MAYSSIRVLVGMVLLSQFEVGFSDDILLVTVELEIDREKESINIIHIIQETIILTLCA